MNRFHQQLLCASILSTCAFNALAEGPASNYGGSFSARFGYSAPADISRGTANLGEMDAVEVGLRYTARIRVSDTYAYNVGVDYERWGFSKAPGLAVPNTLQGVSLVLGNRWKFADKWTLALSARPGLYSDFDDISGDDFSVPVTVFFSYDLNPRWQFLFGVNFQSGRDIPVLPAIGAVWKPTEQWTISITLPRPNVTYAFDDKLAIFAGGELTGGAYTVGDKFGTRLGDPTLDGELLTYREIRAGAGVRYDVSKKLRLEMEGGWVIDRRFIYHDRDLQFNGDGAPYVRIGLSGSY